VNDLEIQERLDDILSVLKIAFAGEIATTRTRLRQDSVIAALLEETAEDWQLSGELQRRVAQSTKTSERTVRDRIAELHALGALRGKGAGRQTQYKSTGIA